MKSKLIIQRVENGFICENDKHILVYESAEAVAKQMTKELENLKPGNTYIFEYGKQD